MSKNISTIPIKLDKKKLGQVILRENSGIIKDFIKIINTISVNRNLVEIGPGTGSLTIPVLNNFPNKSLYCIEIDKNLIYTLSSKLNKERFNKIKIFNNDALKISRRLFIGKLVYGLLPYSTGWKIISRLSTIPHFLGCFILQKEIVEQISSNSRRFWLLYPYVEIQPLSTYSRYHWHRPPKVDSRLFVVRSRSNTFAYDIDMIQYRKWVMDLWKNRRKKLKDKVSLVRNMNLRVEQLLYSDIIIEFRIWLIKRYRNSRTPKRGSKVF